MTDSPVSGPTQNYDAVGESWSAHPWLARGVAVLIWLVPVVLSWGVIWVARVWWPPERTDLDHRIWWLLFGGGALAVLLVSDRAARRLLPLVTLMRIALAFPDQAPSRFRVALRSRTPRELARRESGRIDDLVELLGALTRHDRDTRGHSERVRAYSDLIAEEMKLSETDRNHLAWAAVLHDIGKLDVPAEVLNKRGLPDDEEWAAIKQHPEASETYLAAYAGWLRGWQRTAAEHHERWDGRGYPRGLAGKQIHLGARIVAVADAYDVMTNCRSYKKALPPEVARRELARNAGHQFDPAAVRAFFSAGIAKGSLRWGPFAWLVNLGDRLAEIRTGLAALLLIGTVLAAGALGPTGGDVAGRTASLAAPLDATLASAEPADDPSGAGSSLEIEPLAPPVSHGVLPPPASAPEGLARGADRAVRPAPPESPDAAVPAGSGVAPAAGAGVPAGARREVPDVAQVARSSAPVPTEAPEVAVVPGIVAGVVPARRVDQSAGGPEERADDLRRMVTTIVATAARVKTAAPIV